MNTTFPIAKFEKLPTPFYYYDTELLEATLEAINKEAQKYNNYHIHYAIKANFDPTLLKLIAEKGFGADCVSGGEINAAIAAGFPTDKIVYAGVGKSDWEIELALKAGIRAFNVESKEELEIIAEIAEKLGEKADIALRINPEIDAHTHHYITTGLKENKFGISLEQFDEVVDLAVKNDNINLIGLHFHIGSQITINEPFELLCKRINDITTSIEKRGISLEIINVGGGLGIDYDNPNENPIPDFESYFAIFAKYLNLKANWELHFELGRAIVCQCGSLITRVLYVKEGIDKRFAIVDAGMTELIRPALYQAEHVIENISTNSEAKEYDVVGPICESSDTFAEGISLPELKRGDFIAIRSAGAYGASMAMRYNCRAIAESQYSK